jgi:LmbE family N-acetylglucosaminyl deacetylase
MSVRRDEDIESCHRLGAESLHFSIPDCIYRRSPQTSKHLYDSEQALWRPVHPDEQTLAAKIAAELSAKLPQTSQVVCPLALGGHVDHRLTRMAAEMLDLTLWFYADYPYVLAAENCEALQKRAFTQYTITPQALSAWQKSVAAHQSQIRTFWADLDEMREAIRVYSHSMGGIRLFE